MTVLEDVIEIEKAIANKLDADVTYEQAFGTNGEPRDAKIVEFLGKTPRTWRELIAFLKDPCSTSGIYLWMLAAHASDREILAKLGGDGDRFVRRSVAVNVFTPVDLLLDLSNDDDSIVREAVAENLAAPKELLTALATDPDELVRAAVRDNRNTPIAVKALIPRRSRG